MCFAFSSRSLLVSAIFVHDLCMAIWSTIRRPVRGSEQIQDGIGMCDLLEAVAAKMTSSYQPIMLLHSSLYLTLMLANAG